MSIPHRSPLFGVLCATLLFALVAFSVRAHQVDPAGASPAPLAASAVTGTGTVAELIVDNRVTNVTRRYLALHFDGGATVELTGTGLDALTSGARVEVTGSLSADTLAVASFSVLPSPKVASKAATASQKRVQGTLVIFHKDYFAQGRGEFGLGVHSGAGQMTPLTLPVVPGELQAGMTVSVSGTLAADGVALDASQITILAPPPEQNGPVVQTTTNNVLVMPLKFTDSPVGDPFTPAQVDQVMRTNAGSVANYYSEVSYGQQLLNITVACTTTAPAGCAAHTSTGGWLLASAATPANCDFTTIGNLADQAATAAGYNLANYKNRFYVMPGLACGWAALAYIGYPYQAWSNAYNELWVYGHELRHSFTLYHAGSLNCAPQVLGGGCNVAEYGDRFDVMGNNSGQGQEMHFNAAQKSMLNWIPASSVRTHSSGTATYSLAPLESVGQATYAVKIPVATNANRTYWIEYRQPIGFDSGIAAYPNNGAQIRVAYPFDFPCTGCNGDDTELLDMTPATSGNFYDAALVAGQSYVDATYGINVIVLSATATALTVSVTVSGGTATTTTLTSSANPSNVGANVTFTASVTGSSPTGTVNFTDGGVSIAGCAAVTLSGAGNTRTAACTTNTLVAGAHSIVATYAGDAANNVSTSATLSQVVKAASSTALASSANPSVVGGSVAFTATVTGSAPTGSVGFTADGTTLTGCAAVALPGGSANSKSATCSTVSLAVGTHSIVATYAGDAVNSGSISATLSQVVNATGSINIALAGNGGLASASSIYSSGYAASGAIDNVRSGANWGNGGGGNHATPHNFPDWLQVNFSASQSINRVVVYSVQDNYQNPVEPTDTMIFSLYGLVDFTVQGWNGTSWVILGTVSGNNLVKRMVTFSTYTTDRIRINVTSALNTWSRITEVEAWTATGTPSSTTLTSSGNPS